MNRILLFPLDHVGTLKRVEVNSVSTRRGEVVIKARWDHGGKELFDWFTQMETLVMVAFSDASTAIAYQFMLFHVSVDGGPGTVVEARLHPRRPDFIRR